MFNKHARVAAVVLMFWPAAAQADWLLTPLFGPTFGADTFGREHIAYGAALGWRDEEAFGWEFEVSVAPDFFEGISNGGILFDGTGRVVTGMANALIGLGGD